MPLLALEKEKFAKNCEILFVEVLENRDVDEDDQKSQFHTFLKLLETAVSKKNVEELQLTDLKRLMKLFLSSSSLFDEIEHMGHA